MILSNDSDEVSLALLNEIAVFSYQEVWNEVNVYPCFLPESLKDTFLSKIIKMLKSTPRASYFL